jgi:hypothetical protein
MIGAFFPCALAFDCLAPFFNKSTAALREFARKVFVGEDLTDIAISGLPELIVNLIPPSIPSSQVHKGNSSSAPTIPTNVLKQFNMRAREVQLQQPA